MDIKEWRSRVESIIAGASTLPSEMVGLLDWAYDNVTPQKPADPTNHEYEAGKLRKELVDICNRAASEIDEERNAAARLAPRAEAFDAIQQVLDLMPKRSRGAKEDLAWRLRNRARELLQDDKQS